MLLTNGIDRVVGSLTSTLLSADSALLLADLISRLKSFEQQKYLSAVIAFLIKQYLVSETTRSDDARIPESKTVSGVASLLHVLTKNNESLKDHIISILTRPTIPSLGDSLAARRSLMAAAAQDEGQKHYLSIALPH
jgi:telomere length regulation protein